MCIGVMILILILRNCDVNCNVTNVIFCTFRFDPGADERDKDKDSSSKPETSGDGGNVVVPDVSDSDDSGPEDDNRRHTSDFVSDFDLMLQRVSFDFINMLYVPANSDLQINAELYTSVHFRKKRSRPDVRKGKTLKLLMTTTT